jgi:integrase
MSTQGSIKKDASGKWFFIVDMSSADGKRRQVRKRGYATKKDAQAELTKVLGDVQRGTFVRPAKTTVGAYLREWVASLPAQGRRQSTVDSYRQNIERNVIPTLGGVELQALDALLLDGLYARLLDPARITPKATKARPLSMRTVRYVHTIVGKALADAERKGLVARNVARLATPPAASAAKAPEMHYWTPAELRTFLASAADHHHYPLLRLAAMSGLRRGELCGLRWVDVDLEAGTISVRKSITTVNSKVVAGDVKTKRSRRVIDIDPATMMVVKAWRKTQLEQRVLMGGGWTDTGLVFTMPTGGGWNPDSISQAFDRLVTPVRKASRDEIAARPPRIRFHDLRHTHASHLLAAGVNVKVVSERLGHASVAFTLDTYAHVMPGQQASAAAAVSALVNLS